jgi:hypothetical protein
MMPAMREKTGSAGSKRAAGPGLVLRQAGSGRTVPIGKAPVTIGRHSACEFSMPDDDRLSRQHCAIEPGD